MRRHVIVGASVFIIMLAFTPVWSSAGAGDARVTGTYSSLRFNREGGDLIGIEVRIVRTDMGYKGVVQAAEGGPGDIYIVGVVLEGDRLSFDVPYTRDVKGRFSGKITAAGLVGTLLNPSGESEAIMLPRSQSYWEK